jgi:hypothetical protein
MAHGEGTGEPPARPTESSVEKVPEQGERKVVDLGEAREKVRWAQEWMRESEESFFWNGSALEQALKAVRETGPEGEEMAAAIQIAVKKGYRKLSHLFRERAGIDDKYWNHAVENLERTR